MKNWSAHAARLFSNFKLDCSGCFLFLLQTNYPPQSHLREVLTGIVMGILACVCVSFAQGRSIRVDKMQF